MGLHKVAYRAFVTARRVAVALKLSKVLRRCLGPAAGRLLYSLSGHAGKPLTIQGHKMVLATAGKYPPHEMVSDAWELNTVRLFEHLIQPGDTVLDVGAHVGYFTLIAARSIGPQGHVYAFEPEPDNYKLLIQNLELNGYRNITPVRMAVSNRVGSSLLFSSGLDNGQHSLCRTGRPERRRQIVETTTLDAFLEAQGWPNVEMIKIDIEGAEPLVLDGMSRLLSRQTKLKMVVEFCPVVLKATGVDPREFLGRLTALGFKLYTYGDKANLLESADISRLLDHLYKTASYKNLLCVRS